MNTLTTLHIKVTQKQKCRHKLCSDHHKRGLWDGSARVICFFLNILILSLFLKNKSYNIISIDKRHWQKIFYLFITKRTQETMNNRYMSQHDKDCKWETCCQYYVKRVNGTNFSKIWSDLNLTAFSTFTQHTAQAITNLKMTNKRKT